jgi:DNA recombination protein RmuC
MTDSNLLVAILAVVLVGGAVAIALVVIALGRLAALAGERDALQRDVASLAKELAVVRAQGEDLERDLKQDMQAARAEQRQDLALARSATGERLTEFTGTTQRQFESLARGQGEALKAFGERLADFAASTQRSLAGATEQQATHAKSLTDRLAELTLRNDQKLEAIRGNVEQRLDTMRTENAAKLEQMRATVDEKLQATLDERLGSSFKQVSDRLEQVHKGLGEMQVLAAGVGDLKRVLQNVKSRGGWGEVQLGALLAEMLLPQQYETNVATKPGSRDTVEFAIRLPGRDNAPCWLPIDAKFPLEDWQRLQDALERADIGAADAARAALSDSIRREAKSIRDKYVEPPHTTDFAILFVPTEGLYAELIARPGFADGLQREHRILLTGPTNLAALLNSLQMGFRSLAIEKRSSEVWAVLGAVKTEFAKFGDVLAKTKERIDKAGEELEKAGVRSRVISRKLRDVEAVPESDASRMLGADLVPPIDLDLAAAADDGSDEVR